MTDNEYLAMLLNRGIDKYKNRSNKLDIVEEVRKIRGQLVQLELPHLEKIGAIVIPAEEVQNGIEKIKDWNDEFDLIESYEFVGKEFWILGGIRRVVLLGLNKSKKASAIQQTEALIKVYIE